MQAWQGWGRDRGAGDGAVEGGRWVEVCSQVK